MKLPISQNAKDLICEAKSMGKTMRFIPVIFDVANDPAPREGVIGCPALGAFRDSWALSAVALARAAALIASLISVICAMIAFRCFASSA